MLGRKFVQVIHCKGRGLHQLWTYDKQLTNLHYINCENINSNIESQIAPLIRTDSLEGH